MSGSQKIRDSQEFKAISEYLSSSSVASEDTQKTFCQAVEDSKSAEDAESNLGRQWGAVTNLASTTDDESSKQRLADFVLNISQRKEPSIDGQALRVQDMAVWKDLPILGWELRDAWNFDERRASESSTKEWINLNHFTASLVSRSHSTYSGKPDYTLFGLWSLRSALEEEGTPSEASVAAASTWFIAAAPALYSLSNEGKTFDGKIAKPGSLFKDQEWRGFTKERWGQWEKRLEEVETHVKDEKTAQLVKRAQEALRDVSEKK